MTYAEAVKRATDIWLERLKDPALPLLCAVDREALSILRSVEPLVSAVEKIGAPIIKAGVELHTIGMCRPILRSALSLKERMEKGEEKK